jgi:hypothetical protein
MIPKGVRGNKRSRSEINKIKKRIRALLYSVDPSYSDEEMLARIKIPERTFYRYKSQIWNEDAPKREQDFTSREKVAIKKAMEPLEKQAAEKREKAGVPCEDSSQGKTREKVAQFVDTSFDTLNKLEHIVEVEVFRGIKLQVMKVSQI